MKTIFYQFTFLFFINFLYCESVITKVDDIDTNTYEYTYYSSALDKENKFVIVLPVNYKNNDMPVPVLYFLHGAGRHHRSIIDMPEAKEIIKNAKFVTIFPKGDNGWYIDSPVNISSKYESMITELIEICEKEFNIAKNPDKKAIGGWSMGGFGSMHYVQNHPDKFKIIATIIALLDFPNINLPKEQNHVIPDVMGADNVYWDCINPIKKIQFLKNLKIAIYAADKAFDYTMNSNFHMELNKYGINHSYKIQTGAHSFNIVLSFIPELYKFINLSFDLK